MAKSQAAAEVKTEVDALVPQTENAAKGGFKFKVKKHVTLPLLVVNDEVPSYVKITGAIFQAKELEGSRARKNENGQVQQPPHLFHAINLETGEMVQAIANDVLKSTLEDTYPDESYVGKSFEYVRHAMVKGKKYKTFSITEIEAE